VFVVQFADDAANSSKLKDEIDRKVKTLVDVVEDIRRDVDEHNSTVSGKVAAALETKRKQALAAHGAIASIGIPLRPKNEPEAFVAPVIRRRSPTQRPVPTRADFNPEWVVEEADYLHILSVIRSLSLVIERNPSSFVTLEEQAIRDHILLQLNGHYEGAATGETFNGIGKTDILIRVKDRNIFIAECKFWGGPKKFEEAIDQLFDRYLTWRDCKCAVIVFNRQSNTSSVVQKMHETMTNYKGHRKTASNDANGSARYVFVKDSDPGREIHVTTLVFDVPS
jgi:hypothetical protein